MTPALQLESERLAETWMQYDAARLGNYLVQGVEDPRINLQSVLSRHFLIEAILRQLSSLPGPSLSELAPVVRLLVEQDYLFSAVMNWFLAAVQWENPEEREILLHALKHGSDNAEGLPVPAFMCQAFSRLPCAVGSLTVPNYLETFLSAGDQPAEERREFACRTFEKLWRTALSSLTAPQLRLSVFEPACGSANDFRYLDAYGIGALIDYTGFDLCQKNVENARALFSAIQFETGNVFDIHRPDKSFDLCFVHDLFEHLSLEGLEAAIKEICRLTRQGLCLGFFNMANIPEHILRPVDDYHCNTLSLARIKESFARCGFDGQIIDVAAFLNQKVGCKFTHNANAYTQILQPKV